MIIEMDKNKLDNNLSVLEMDRTKLKVFDKSMYDNIYTYILII